MNILYIDNVKFIMTTARSIQVSKTCSALARHGANVTLVGMRGTGSINDVRNYYGLDDNFTIKRIYIPTFKRLYSILYRSAYGLFILLNKSDLIYTRDLGVALIADALGRPFMFELHSMPVRPQQEWMLSRVIQAANLVSLVSITEAIERELLHTYKLNPRQSTVIACGGEVDQPWRFEQHRPQDPYRVGYVGHLYPGKGGATIARLAENNPELEFHVVGEITDKSAFPSMPPNIVAHGMKSHSEAMAILDTFHCAIAPYGTRTEAVDGKVISDWFSPLKVFEYMAHSKPIVCSDLPVIREVLTHEVTALLVPPDDIDAWSTALARLRADEALARNLSASAYKEIQSKFSYDERAKRILAAASSSPRLPDQPFTPPSGKLLDDKPS
jgi:glycosyltransferase involved in cell wall biosynthesis